MINLIPPVARKKIVHEYWTRVITVWMFLVGTTSLIVIFLLLPTYVLISTQISALEHLVANSSDKTSSYDASVASLLEASKQAQLLMENPDLVPFSSYFSQLEEMAGHKVVINGQHFVRQKDTATIQVSGVASTRQSLADFRDTVEADENFIKVELPISSLIKDSDLLFSMQITLSTTTKEKVTIPSS